MARTEIRNSDRDEIGRFILRHWGSHMVMSRGRRYYPHEEEGFVEQRDGEIVGVLTYHVHEADSELGDGMEILTLNSTVEGQGIGSALMLGAIEKAREIACRRIWLTTTNDNLRAIGFYQRLSFRMVAIHLGAVDAARKIKPEIPLSGYKGLPIHDEIVMELLLKPYLDDSTPGRST